MICLQCGLLFAILCISSGTFSITSFYANNSNDKVHKCTCAMGLTDQGCEELTNTLNCQSCRGPDAVCYPCIYSTWFNCGTGTSNKLGSAPCLVCEGGHTGKLLTGTIVSWIAMVVNVVVLMPLSCWALCIYDAPQHTTMDLHFVQAPRRGPCYTAVALLSSIHSDTAAIAGRATR